MLPVSVQIVLILVVGAIVMMLIAAISRRGLEMHRSKIIFAPPETGRAADLEDAPRAETSETKAIPKLR